MIRRWWPMLGLTAAGCLYTQEIPTPSTGNNPPDILNVSPGPDGSVYLPPQGILFEVWASDDDPEDQPGLLRIWYLNNVQMASGAKVLVRRSQLPEGESAAQLRLRVQDPRGARARDVVWNLYREPLSEQP